MKKILAWLKSPKSDFVLFIFLIILLNIAGYRAYHRFDITAPKSYSLSKESKQLVKNLQEPLSIRVFFDDNLPTQYNQIYQYIKDILVEYKGAANKNFSVSYMDMKKQENVRLAQDLGLQQVQIQEVKSNEVGFKQGYMAIVVSYGDSIEIMNPISTTDGFEYKLTSKLSKMISMADTLNGIKGNDKITLTLYLSDVLKALGINGTEQAQDIIYDAFVKINKRNMDRLSFKVVNPTSEESIILSEKYGIQTVGYDDENGVETKASVGLVLEHGDAFYSLPLKIQKSLFGYVLGGLESVENSIDEGLKSLLSNVQQIGYITGHMEIDHESEENAGNLKILISGMYELVDIDLSKDDIPTGMNSVIINGPKYDYTEEELYKLDQFVMRGGNILFFVDGVQEQESNSPYSQNTFVPFSTNLDRLLENYGVKREQNMVMDTKCHESAHPKYGKVQYNWVPLITTKQLPKKHVITNNLNFIYMLKNAALDVSKALEDKNIKTTVLIKSSEKSWKMDNGIVMNPLYLSAPADSEMDSYNLAVLLEGKFNSIFDAAPVTENDNSETAVQNQLKTSDHISTSVMPGKIFVTGSSAVTTYQLIDAEGTAPASMFLMNVIDYMNGHEDLCVMRSKVLGINNLEIKSYALANFWKWFEIIGLPLIFAVLSGFIVWRIRCNRKKAINEKYNPNDARTIK